MYRNRHNLTSNYGEGKRKKYSKKRSRSCHKPNCSSTKKKQRKSKITIENCKISSQYIGKQRLTNQIGIFAKGKTSNSITRMASKMPDEIKARAQEDLHMILRKANGSNLNPPPFQLNNNLETYENSSPISPLQCSKVSDFKLIHHDTSSDNISAFFQQDALERNYSSTKTEFQISKEIIQVKLHDSIRLANLSIFPNISNQNRIKSELVALREQYNATNISRLDNSFENKNILTETENIDNFILNQVNEITRENKFQFKPVLEHVQAVPDKLESLFPKLSSSSQTSSDNGSDCELRLQENCFSNYSPYTTLSNLNADKESDSALLAVTPTSSSDSLVWKPNVSPIQFPQNQSPSPKLYYRRNMF